MKKTFRQLCLQPSKELMFDLTLTFCSVKSIINLSLQSIFNKPKSEIIRMTIDNLREGNVYGKSRKYSVSARC